jgi:probable phosphoglycerate mutase
MRPPGGESRAESSQRVHDAVLRHVEEAADDADLLVVAHGAVIRGATELLLGMTEASGHLGVLTNCTYAHLIPGETGWVLRSWGGGAEAVARAQEKSPEQSRA